MSVVSCGPTSPARCTSWGIGAVNSWAHFAQRHVWLRCSVMVIGRATNSTCWKIRAGSATNSTGPPHSGQRSIRWSSMRSISSGLNAVRSCFS